MRYSLLLLSAAVLVCCFGCGQDSDKLTSAPRTETALPSGWKEISTSGFAMSFPPGWTPIDLATSDLEKSGEAALGKDPKFDTLRSQIHQMAAAGMFKLFVFDSKKVGSAFADNCNVNVTEVGPATIDQVADAAKTQIATMVQPGTQPTGDFQDLKVGRCSRLKSTLKMGPSGVASLAYSTIKDGKLYTITFSSLPKDAAAMEKTAKSVMDTFRFSG